MLTPLIGMVYIGLVCINLKRMGTKWQFLIKVINLTTCSVLHKFPCRNRVNIGSWTWTHRWIDCNNGEPIFSFASWWWWRWGICIWLCSGLDIAIIICRVFHKMSKSGTSGCKGLAKSSGTILRVFYTCGFTICLVHSWRIKGVPINSNNLCWQGQCVV